MQRFYSTLFIWKKKKKLFNSSVTSLSQSDSCTGITSNTGFFNKPVYIIKVKSLLLMALAKRLEEYFKPKSTQHLACLA